MTTSEFFSYLEQELERGGVDAVLQKLDEELRRKKEYHELFEVLKMKVRRRLSLPLFYRDDGDDLEDEQRKALEDGLIDACRTVGMALFAMGKIREGWMYLRPVGDNAAVTRQLAHVPINDENRDEMVEVALHEGIDIELGYQLVLDHYGTCNAITTYQNFAHGRNRTEMQRPCGQLVRHVHAELLESVCSDIQRQEGKSPAEATLLEMLEGRDSLFGEYSYHIDASHLSSTVQASRCLDDPELLRLAIDLTEYGKRLDKQFQYPGEEPFVETYPHHQLYFRALLGEDVDTAIEHFRGRAQNIDAYQQGSIAVETYIELLARLGRGTEAINATIELIPSNVHTTGLAPDLLELAKDAEVYEPVLNHYRQRDNLLGYATALMQSAEQEKSQQPATTENQ